MMNTKLYALLVVVLASLYVVNAVDSLALPLPSPCGEYYAVSAELNAFGPGPGGHSFVLPTVPFGPDFNFVTQNNTQSSGVFTLNETNARFDGWIVSSTNANALFQVSISLFRVNSTAKTELNATAYVANGGPINASSFIFYEFSAAAYLVGRGDLEGVNITLIPVVVPFQIGFGANGKNFNFGGSGWFNFTINNTVQMGDINVDLILPPLCAMEANASQFGVLGGQALFFNLTGTTSTLSTRYLLTNTSTPSFIFLMDNTAIVNGNAVAIDNSTVTFVIDLRFNFSERATPFIELNTTAFDLFNFTNPDNWFFFPINGTQSFLNGTGSAAGTTIVVSSHMGMPMQIGFGANNKNLNYGASSWFNATLFGSNGERIDFILDINVDLQCCVQIVPITFPNVTQPTSTTGTTSTTSAATTTTSTTEVVVATTGSTTSATIGVITTGGTTGTGTTGRVVGVAGTTGSAPAVMTTSLALLATTMLLALF